MNTANTHSIQLVINDVKPHSLDEAKQIVASFKSALQTGTKLFIRYLEWFELHGEWYKTGLSTYENFLERDFAIKPVWYRSRLKALNELDEGIVDLIGLEAASILVKLPEGDPRRDKAKALLVETATETGYTVPVQTARATVGSVAAPNSASEDSKRRDRHLGDREQIRRLESELRASTVRISDLEKKVSNREQAMLNCKRCTERLRDIEK